MIRTAVVIAALVVAAISLVPRDTRDDTKPMREPRRDAGVGIAVAWAQPTFDLQTLVRRSEAVVVADVIATRDVPQVPSDDLHGPPPCSTS